MCLSFVFQSVTPSIECKRAPKDWAMLEAYDAFSLIMTSRCEQAAKCTYLICVEFGKWLTYLHCIIEDNLDYKNITCKFKSYKHCTGVFSEQKAKCNFIRWRVLSWHALQQDPMLACSSLIICLSKSLHTQFLNGPMEQVKYLFMWKI